MSEEVKKFATDKRKIKTQEKQTYRLQRGCDRISAGFREMEEVCVLSLQIF